MEKITILFKAEDPNEELWFDHFQSTLRERCPDFDVSCHEAVNDNQVDIAKAINSSRLVCLLDTPSLQYALYECRDWLSSYLFDNVCIISVCDESDSVAIILDEEFEHYSKWEQFSLSADGEANLKTYEAINALLKKAKKPTPKRRKPKDSPENKGLELPSAVEGKIECVCPMTICRDGVDKQVLIVFKTMMSADIRIEIADVSGEIEYIKRNPYVVEFTAPERKPGKALIKVYEAGKLLPDKWSLRYADPNLAQFQCLASLMKSLRIEDGNIQELDKKLANIFLESCPRDQVLQRFYDNNNCPTDPISRYEFPTLLHFAAYHGLEELVATFMNSPLGINACNIANHKRHDPAEMAKNNGNQRIAQYIRDEMAVAHVMDEYVNFHISKKGGDEPYDDINKFIRGNSRFDRKGYLIMNRPAGACTKDGYVVKMSSEMTPKEGYVQMFGQTTSSTPGYVSMTAGGKKSGSEVSAKLKRSQSDRLERSESPIPEIEDRSAVTLPRNLTPSVLFGMKGAGKDILPQEPVMGSQALGELEEIRDFAANQEYSIDEIIMLFKMWNDQHAAGSQSFKQRQEALADMRRDIQKKEAEQKAKKKGFKSIFGKKIEKKRAFEISDPIHFRGGDVRPTEDRDSSTSTGSSDRSSRGSKTDSSGGNPDEWPTFTAPTLPPRLKENPDLYTKINKKTPKRMPPPPPPKSVLNRAPQLPPRQN